MWGAYRSMYANVLASEHAWNDLAAAVASD
jgi:hypothetical protein